MTDEPGHAPGPAKPSVDPDAEKSDRVTDARAANLDAVRRAEAAGAVPPVPPPVGIPITPPGIREDQFPAEAIVVTELQEMKARLDLIGKTELAQLMLLGTLVAFVVIVARKGGVE